MEYYSAIKKNAFDSVLMRWIKLEPIIQSEVWQKSKRKLKKNLETNDNENTTTQNLWDTAKAVRRGKFIAI